MKLKSLTTALAAASIMFASCSGDKKAAVADQNFNYNVNRFADIEVLRYKVPGFEELTPQQRILIYHLTEAALAGRDILWDQNCRYNLPIRDLIEGVYTNYKGDKDDANYKALELYLKQIEFANGIHHHYSMDKFTPGFTEEWLRAQLADMPGKENIDIDALAPVIFDPAVMSKRVNQAQGQDLILTSACNLYGDGVTQQEVEDYYAALKDTTDTTPVSYGLNSRLVRGADGKLTEEVYKVGAATRQPSRKSSATSMPPSPAPRTTGRRISSASSSPTTPQATSRSLTTTPSHGSRTPTRASTSSTASSRATATPSA